MKLTPAVRKAIKEYHKALRILGYDKATFEFSIDYTHDGSPSYEEFQIFLDRSTSVDEPNFGDHFFSKIDEMFKDESCNVSGSIIFDWVKNAVEVSLVVSDQTTSITETIK